MRPQPGSGGRAGAKGSWGVGGMHQRDVAAVVDAGHSGAEQVWNEDEAREGDEHEDDEHEDDEHEDEDEDEDGAPAVVVDHVVTSDAAG